MDDTLVDTSPIAIFVANHAATVGWWLALPVPLAIAVAACMWAIYLLLIWSLPCLSLETKREGADRILGVTHSLVSTVLGCSIEFWIAPVCNIGNSWVKGSVLITLAYLVVDFFSMLIIDVWKGWRKVDISMFVHHIFIVFCFGIGCLCDVGVFFLGCLLVNEASTPFMFLKWLFEYKNMKGTNAYISNGIMFVLVFFVCRIAFIPFSAYQMASVDFCRGSSGYGPAWLLEVFPPLMGLAYVGIFSLNLIWFIKLIRGALKVLTHKDKAFHRLNDEANKVEMQTT